MKKFLAILLGALMMFALLSACGDGGAPPDASIPPASSTDSPPPSETPAETETPPESPTDTGPAPYRGVLLMATTTSTDNTGLLDYLAPVFLEDTGWELQWVSVGTGEALQHGMDGEVDVVLVHAKAREETFVADGYGVERFQVMYNDYVIVGPADGPIGHSGDVKAVFQQILDESLTFISRGDDSGTHTQEKNIWNALDGADYEANPGYVSAGAGMAATIIMADEMEGYTLSDRGTWLSTKKNADNDIGLEIVCEGDAMLLNQYGVIAVSADKFPDTNIEAASAFVQWICSPEIQELIGQFGVEEYGEPLFVPNAK